MELRLLIWGKMDVNWQPHCDLALSILMIRRRLRYSDKESKAPASRST